MYQEGKDQKKILLLEPHYLGNIEYYGLLSRYDEVRFEVNDHFIKQTFRNRCLILTANGVLPLIIPVRFGNRTTYKDVKIDHSQSWVKDHNRAITSAYGKAPYYDYLVDDFLGNLNSSVKYLHDVNMAMMTICLKILNINVEISETQKFESSPESCLEDFRNVISPKKNYLARNIYRSSRYLQIFGKEFVPNLSVLDTIMCLGPQSSEIIDLSTKV